MEVNKLPERSLHAHEDSWYLIEGHWEALGGLPVWVNQGKSTVQRGPSRERSSEKVSFSVSFLLLPVPSLQACPLFSIHLIPISFFKLCSDTPLNRQHPAIQNSSTICLFFSEVAYIVLESNYYVLVLVKGKSSWVNII